MNNREGNNNGRGRLPLSFLTNAEFRQDYGPRQQQLQQQVFPPAVRTRNAAAWTIAHRPTNEPGVFTDRLVMEYDSAMIIPAPNAQWDAQEQRVLRQLTDSIDLWLVRHPGFQMAKVYLVHKNNDLEIVNPQQFEQRSARGHLYYPCTLR